MVLGNEVFDAAHLMPILTDPCILKLCYDIRGDGAALYLQHGIRVHGFYDLQVVYTSLHQSPGDPFLKGLHRAIERIIPSCAACAFAERKAVFRKNAAYAFLKRPIEQELLAYAAWDVTYLMEMFRAWSPYVSTHSVLMCTSDRLMRHIRQRERGGGRRTATIAAAYPPHHHSSSNNNNNNSNINNANGLGVMSRVDFAPVRAKRLCFVVPVTKFTGSV